MQFLPTDYSDDPLLDALTKRDLDLSGGPDATIGARPEPPMSRKALELITGFPAEPREMTPGDAINLLLMGLGVGKGIQTGGKALYRKALGVGDASPKNISKDLYGMNPQMGRRGFFDRMSGKPEKRLKNRIQSVDDYLTTRSENIGIFDELTNPDGWKALGKQGYKQNQGHERIFNKTETGLRKELKDLINIDDIKIDSRSNLRDLLDGKSSTSGPVSNVLESFAQEIKKRLTHGLK